MICVCCGVCCVCCILCDAFVCGLCVVAWSCMVCFECGALCCVLCVLSSMRCKVWGVVRCGLLFSGVVLRLVCNVVCCAFLRFMIRGCCDVCCVCCVLCVVCCALCPGVL